MEDMHDPKSAAFTNDSAGDLSIDSTNGIISESAPDTNLGMDQSIRPTSATAASLQTETAPMPSFFQRTAAPDVTAWDPTRRSAGSPTTEMRSDSTWGTPTSPDLASPLSSSPLSPSLSVFGAAPPTPEGYGPAGFGGEATRLLRGEPERPLPPAAQWEGQWEGQSGGQWGAQPTNATPNPASNPSWDEQHRFGAPTSPIAAPTGSGAVAAAGGWKKPALAGGLVGALMASAVLGVALVSTRRSQNDRALAIERTSAVTDSAASTPATSSGPIFTIKNGIDIPGIVKRMEPSVVSISTKGFPTFQLGTSEVPEGAGSGIVLSKDGFILTNAHVIADASAIKVAIPGGKTYDADVIGRDASNDIAVVKARNVNDLVPAKLGKSKELVVGEPVVAIGNALALAGSPTVTSGIISAVNRDLESDTERLTGVLQTDTAINPGNSGGPLVNAKGEVIGMNTAIFRGSNNIGFAIAMDRIQPVVDRLRSGEPEKPRTFLGVTTQTMDKATQDLYSLGTDKGAIVIEITIGSPAENAGLQRGDIITKFDGKTITDNRALGDLVRKRKAGDEVPMTFMRGLQSIDTEVTLGAARRAN
jgi:S1-C subfamily serine protease